MGQPDGGLTPVAERYDETTEANLMRKDANEDSYQSPNGLNTLRSDSKMLQQNKIEALQAPEPDQSQILNVDDSSKAISVAQAAET